MKSTHDLSSRSWGNNYEIMSLQNKGYDISLAGWRKNITVGDYIILRRGQNDTTRYVIEEISYENDPDDMFYAKAKFAPRE